MLRRRTVMLASILLIAATAGIAAFARGRGGNPWVWGTLTVVGYFVVRNLILFPAALLNLARTTGEDAQFWSFLASIGWLAALAFCARFILGRKHAKPDGIWSCRNCRYLNQPYAVMGEACQQPYGRKPQAVTPPRL